MKTSRIVAGALVVALSAGTYGVAEAATSSKSTKTTKVSLGTAAKLILIEVIATDDAINFNFFISSPLMNVGARNSEDLNG